MVNALGIYLLIGVVTTAAQTIKMLDDKSQEWKNIEAMIEKYEDRPSTLVIGSVLGFAIVTLVAPILLMAKIILKIIR